MDIPHKFAEGGRRACGFECSFRKLVLDGTGVCAAEGDAPFRDGVCPEERPRLRGVLLTADTFEELDDIGPSCWKTSCQFLRRGVFLPNGAPGTCSCESARSLCPRWTDGMSYEGVLLTMGTEEER